MTDDNLQWLIDRKEERLRELLREVRRVEGRIQALKQIVRSRGIRRQTEPVGRGCPHESTNAHHSEHCSEHAHEG